MFRTLWDYLLLLFTRRMVFVLAVLLLVLCSGYLWWISREPPVFDVQLAATERAASQDREPVIGYVTTATLIQVSDTLLNKRGGYLSNDVMPPWVLLDNMPNWELGVLWQIRDLARALRNDFSRSQTQSQQDSDLAVAEPKFNFDNSSWLLPRTESEYRDAIRALERYLDNLSDPTQPDAQFFARADNLNAWLAQVEKRLGDLGQRLSASVGQLRINTDLSGEASAQQSTYSPEQMRVKTPWLEIDDVFYEARGATWALLHFLRALEVDLNRVLQDKNANVSVRQIIRELEAAQQPIRSPMILNGSPFGAFANHSLVMANYIARANAAIIDLRHLLTEG